MTAATAAAWEHGLDIGDVADLSLAAVRAPHLSVIQWLVSAGAPRAAQSAFASAIALATPPSATRVLAALGVPGLGQLPEFITPLPPAHDATVQETLDAVRDAPAGELAREVAAGRPRPAGGAPPSTTRPAGATTSCAPPRRRGPSAAAGGRAAGTRSTARSAASERPSSPVRCPPC